VVYFFYVSILHLSISLYTKGMLNLANPIPTQPETSGRSLEEMDDIFRAVHGFKGAFTVVKVAHEMPRRYGKKGELLINYDETDAAVRRRSSVAAQQAGVAKKFSGDESGEKLEVVDVESGNGFK